MQDGSPEFLELLADAGMLESMVQSAVEYGLPVDPELIVAAQALREAKRRGAISARDRQRLLALCWWT
jgi:hypothetical protein